MEDKDKTKEQEQPKAEEQPKEQPKAEEKPKAKEEAEDTIYNDIKNSYEEKLIKQAESYEAKLSKRDKIIKQLMAGEADANKAKPSFIDKLNERRIAQNKY